MTVYDLIALDQKVRATLTTINAEALRLFQRREDLTDRGLRTQWNSVVARYAPKVEDLAKEVEDVSAALGRVHDHERDYLLPPGPLSTQQELLLQRILARPNVFDTQSIGAVVGPHLKTPVATALVEEIKVRNHEITDDYLDGILARASVLYSEAINDMHLGRTILSVLEQGVEALRDALEYENVNSLPLDHHRRPGIGIASLQDMLGADAEYRIGHDGNTHV